MPRNSLRAVCVAVLAGLSAACTDNPPADSASAGSGALMAFTGAVIIDGTGAPAVKDGVLVVSEGRIQAVGPASEVEVPQGAMRINLEGAYVVPGFVNAHGHVGVSDGLVGETGAHTRDNVLRQLSLYARYGITTVVSLGDPGTETLPLRAAQQDASLTRARIYGSGPVLTPSSPEEAVRDVVRMAAAKVDWLKVRVDDALGNAQKMPPDVYGALMSAAREHDLPVAGHVVYLEDAKELLRRGVNLLAHSVRDAAVDDELIRLMRERDVCITPTFTREVSVFAYADRPAFFDDPFFLAEANPEVVTDLQRPERQAAVRNSAAARYYREALPLAQSNMMALHNAGVRVAMGTDTGPVARFQGYFEHLEMQMMHEAGMSPADVLVASTGRAAACMGLTDVGTLEPGKWADFVVLERNPLEDILATRAIREVRVAGNRIAP
jgi:imidazolonepropionase-like amidohydrolase